MTAAITIPGSNFNDPTLPVRGADELLTGGTLHMFDFGNPDCYPAQVSPITTGIIGISPQGYTGTRTGGTGDFLFAGGGCQWATAVSGLDHFRFSSQDFNLFGKQDREYLICAWLKPANSGTASFSPQFYRIGQDGGTRSATTNFINIEAREGNWIINNGGDLTPTLAFAADTLVQIAYHIKYDDVAETASLVAYLNGERKGTIPLNWVAWTTAAAACAQLGASAGANNNGANGRIYRGFVEDVSLSQIDPDYWIARDFELNDGRFS